MGHCEAFSNLNPQTATILHKKIGKVTRCDESCTVFWVYQYEPMD